MPHMVEHAQNTILKQLILLLNIYTNVSSVLSEPQVGPTTSTPSGTSSTTSGPGQGTGETGNPIRATAPMWRCSRIMHMQRDLHPTILSSLEGIVDQVL